MTMAGEMRLMNCAEDAIIERGINHKIEGRYEEATQAFKEALLANPDSTDGHHQLGLVYGFTGLFDESLEELQIATKLSPDRVDIRVDLALTYSMLGMYEEAKAEFEEVLIQDPSNKRAIENLQFFN